MAAPEDRAFSENTRGAILFIRLGKFRAQNVTINPLFRYYRVISVYYRVIKGIPKGVL